MLMKKVFNRITIDEIREHPWITGQWRKKASSVNALGFGAISVAERRRQRRIEEKAFGKDGSLKGIL